MYNHTVLLCIYAQSYSRTMALVISPARFPPASLACQSLRPTRELYYCCSPARYKRNIHRSTSLRIQDSNDKSSSAAAVLEERKRGSGSSRRQFLVLLLSSSGTLPLEKLADGSNGAAAAATASANIVGQSSEGGADELQGLEKSDIPIIGDLFGFDGLGKTPEEYVLGKVVALAQAGDGAVLFLGVDGFELPLQLVVGPAEAMAVLTAVQERKSRRPMTHEAWGLSLAAVGWKVGWVTQQCYLIFFLVSVVDKFYMWNHTDGVRVPF